LGWKVKPGDQYQDSNKGDQYQNAKELEDLSGCCSGIVNGNKLFGSKRNNNSQLVGNEK
jgi:hypothetical protein